MKIGWFTETFLPQTNGVVKSLETFGQELTKRGHEIHVYCPKTDVKEHMGMHIHPVRSVTFKPYPEFKIGLPFHMKTEKFDLIHTHGPFFMGRCGVKVAKKQKIPKTSTFHTMLSDYVEYVAPIGKSWAKKLTWKYCKSHYSKYNRLITPSEATRKVLAEQVRQPITVIPNGIDVKHFKPMENPREKLGLTNDGKVFLSLGRLGYEKHVDVIIKAATEFLGPNDVLVVAGKGPAKESLEEIAKTFKVQDKIKFAGYVADELVPYYYSAADAFIIASSSETQGLVAAEAMACKCPVVAANAGALPEIVKQGTNGFLFEPSNIPSLVEAVKKIEGEQKLRKNAWETAQEFTIEKSTDKLEKFYEMLLKTD